MKHNDKVVVSQMKISGSRGQKSFFASIIAYYNISSSIKDIN